MYVDSHCHLSFPELHDRVPELRREMAATGVDRALCICTCLLYTSDAADERSSVDLGGRRIIQKKKNKKTKKIQLTAAHEQVI